jgi:NAD(P)H dehydrogenase (quinone)
MRVFIVHAHHEPRSMNGALTAAATAALMRAGHEVEVSDLHAMGFDPVSDRRNFTTAKDETYLKQQLEEMHAVASGTFAPDVAAEMRKVEACDLMIWQFPLWWFGPPAILKGWVDRVFAMGFAYGGGKIYESGPFRGKRALLSLTTGGPQASYAKGGFNGDLDGILRPLQRGMLRFCGFDVLAPHVVFGPVRLADDERAAVLAAWAARLSRIEEESPIDVGTY